MAAVKERGAKPAPSTQCDYLNLHVSLGDIDLTRF